MSNASNLANIALPDFGQTGQVLTSTGSTTTPVFSAIPTSDVNTTFLAGSGTTIEVGASNTSVKVNLLDCPDWKIGKTGINLNNETGSNRVSQQATLSANFQRHLQYIVAQNPPLSSVDYITTPNGTFGGGGDYSGCCLMMDGRVFCVPYNITTAAIYDPIKNSVTVPTPTFGSGGAYPTNYSTAILLTDGRIFVTPRARSTALIYDPVKDTLFTPPGSFASDERTIAAVTKNGKVFWPGSNYALIYDPVTNVLTTLNGIPNNYYATPLFDGRILTNSGIFDPDTLQMTTPSGFSSFQLGTMVQLPNGKIYSFGTYVTQFANLYDIATGTVTNLKTPPSFDGGYSCQLLSDGRVFIPPNYATISLIYDPNTDSYTTPSGTFNAGLQHNQGGFNSCIQLLDGRVYCVPSYSTTARILNISKNVNFSPAALTGPCLNTGYY